jgi:periplasmic divalent cation tolerance protein
MSQSLVEVRVSVPDEDTGLRLARDLVEARAAACVQCLGPMTSVYRWEGAVQVEREWLLLAKTTEAALARLKVVVVDGHPYDVPEVIAVPVGQALGPYAEWVREQVADQR